MAWNSQNVFKVRNLVIGDQQQRNWGVALADGELTRRLTFDPSAYVGLSKEFRSDRDKTGKGHDFPTYRVATDQNTQFDITVDLDDYLLGWIPAFVMGGVTTVGIAAPYTHTIKFQQASGTAPCTTVYAEDTTGLKAKFPDFGINQVEFSGSGRGVVQCRLSMIGSGRRAAGAIGALPALPAAVKELLASDVQVLIGAPGGAAAIDVDRVTNWSVTIIQDIEPHRGPGSGIYATQLKIGHPTVRLAMSISADAADDLVNLFLNDTEREVQININSGAACQLKFKFPSIYFSQAQPATDGREVVIQVESNEDSLLKKAGQEFLEVTAINSQPSYLSLSAA